MDIDMQPGIVLPDIYVCLISKYMKYLKYMGMVLQLNSAY